MEPIDGVVDRLDAALRGAGFEGLAAQTEAAALEKVARKIAPWSLPEDLQRFWERHSFASLRARGFGMPQPLDPRAALETYGSRLPAGVMGYGPPLLFPIASEGASRWSIELSTSSTTGGVVFSHGGDQMYAEYPTFTDLLEVCAELLEEGHFMPAEKGSALLIPEQEQARQQTRFERVRRVTSMGEDAGVVVDDGTGMLEVWCPAGTSPWTLVIRRRYEFEVRVPRADGRTDRAVATDIRLMD